MEVFLTIAGKLVPLYLLIFLGFIAGKYLKAQKETLAHLLIYIISPILILIGAMTAPIAYATFSIPLLIFLLCSVISIIFLLLGNIFFHKDTSKNIMAFSAGAGNVGYFGLPVVLALLGNNAFSYATLGILGFILYENTVGFYITAKANYSVHDSLIKISRLPTIYAFITGIILNIAGVIMNESLAQLTTQFKGAYTILGMMIIGMSLVTVRLHHIDLKYISFTFFAKFIVWPMVIIGLVFCDSHLFHFYPIIADNVLIILSLVPMAANTVAVATELRVHPDKAALTVLLSTLFALVYIPIMSGIFLIH